MRHKLTLLFIVFLAFGCLGQTIKYDAGDLILDTALSYSEKDTSATLYLRDYNSINVLLNDRSGNDSVNARIYFDQATDPTTLIDWTVQDSFDVSTDSTWKSWNITEFPILPWPYYRIRIDMLSDTVIDTTATVKISRGNAYNRR